MQGGGLVGGVGRAPSEEVVPENSPRSQKTPSRSTNAVKVLLPLGA